MSKSIKIVSDGTINGTKVLNSDGTPIPYVQRCVLTFDIDVGVAFAELTVSMPISEIDNVSVSELKRPLRPVYSIGFDGEPVTFIQDLSKK